MANVPLRLCSRRRLILGFGAAGLAPLFAFPTRRLTLCGIPFEEIRNGRSPRRYLFIHGDETTARDVLREHIRTHHGRALLVTGTEREVEIEGVKLDPNRMFSRVGAEANLRKLNPELTAERINHVLDFLDAHREEVVRAVLPQPGGQLVVLHNNSRGYSVEDEVPISDAVSLPERSSPHQFFLTTDVRDFDILKTSPYNVVLQNHAPKEDDGSLSRLAARRGVRYVNLEVEIGHPELQQERLNWLEAHVPAKR